MSRRVAPPSLSISHTQAIGIWLLLLLIAGLALLLALLLGGSDLTMGQSLQALLVRGDDLATSVVYDLRLPRALAAFATGGLLAVAGCLMQVLLRNPLADPYILGLSGAAAVGALVAMLLGTSMFLVNSSAAIGALLSSLLIFAASHRDLIHLRGPGAEFDSSRLILTGVMIAALWGAIVTLILVMAPDHNLRGMLFWVVGDLGGVDSYAPALFALLVLCVLVAAMALILRQLNVLLRGEAVAATLGVRVGWLKTVIFVAASVATATAVSTAGTVGFVGLVVPHALRLIIGNDQRVLLPACAIAGGTLLLIADSIARTIVDPLQLPVGIVMVFLGAPTFLYLLLKRSRRT